MERPEWKWLKSPTLEDVTMMYILEVSHEGFYQVSREMKIWQLRRESIGRTKNRQICDHIH
eukprot:scaffold659_cov192-Ochromonas_danica.AAC.20